MVELNLAAVPVPSCCPVASAPASVPTMVLSKISVPPGSTNMSTVGGSITGACPRTGDTNSRGTVARVIRFRRVELVLRVGRWLNLWFILRLFGSKVGGLGVVKVLQKKT
jgi:hypothetical protein